MDVLFKHGFENDTLGTYLGPEFKRDWLNPPWNSRQPTTRIVQDTADANNPSQTLRVFFPENSLGPQEGGAQWWTELDFGNEVYISYDLKYMPGFQFQIGGKLPSAMGGNVAAGVKPDGYDGFTAGLAFNTEGQVRFYLYYPDQPTDTYGQTIVWGHQYAADAFAPSRIVLRYATGTNVRCVPGTWHNITYRVVLNTINASGTGNYDGIVEAYFDGELVTQISDILFRHTESLKLTHMRMYTFFGGSTDDFRNPIAEWVEFDNFILYTFKEGVTVPRGHVLSPTTRTIDYRGIYNGN